MQESTQLGVPFPLDRLTLPLKPNNARGGCLEVLEAENGTWGNQIFKITRQKEPEARTSWLGTPLPQTSGTHLMSTDQSSDWACAAVLCALPVLWLQTVHPCHLMPIPPPRLGISCLW